MTHDPPSCPTPAPKRPETVAAVVVTYNRKDLLALCLDALFAQTRPIDAIYVIDNASTDGTGQMISEHYPGRVIHERLPENTGGAGGFHHGVKRAYGGGYDWLWVMDDDVVPESSCLELLLTSAEPDLPFVAPLVKNARTGQYQLYHHKHRIDVDRCVEVNCQSVFRDSSVCPIELEANAFLGVLINTKSVRRAGLPNAFYFILYDDTDFTYRLSRCGTRGRLVPSALVYHHDGNDGTPIMQTWKAYYAVRNHIFFYGQHAGFGGHIRLAAGALRVLLHHCAGRAGLSVGRGVLDGYRHLWTTRRSETSAR
jgi:GT2 family glycosyltransferase